KGLRMSAEEKGFINYWFRHPWEYILPLYPGILLAAAITQMELRNLILGNILFAALIFVTGFLFSMRNISSKGPGAGVQGPGEKHHASRITHHASLLMSFLPLGMILVLVMGLHIELHYGLVITLAVLFLYYRLGPREIGRALKYGFTRDVIVLIFGIMLFKFSLEDSGAVMKVSEYFREQGIPLLPVLFILPFVSGLLTGITVGFVGSTFPLIISLAGGAHLNQIALAFASGFAGVLLSPVHLCFVLTREYFKADVWGIYKKTIPATAIIMAAALTEYFLL
ncbi:MAG: DUF401 family protein, partial [Nitrospirales bacterium]|nr:DUF401 family protein [Nitrospirales bacterium]